MSAVHGSRNLLDEWAVPAIGEGSAIHHSSVQAHLSLRADSPFRGSTVSTDLSARLPSGGTRVNNYPIKFGFRSGDRGTHGSRSILVGDLQTLLTSVPSGAAPEGYRAAITEENVLGKGSASLRQETWQKTRQLYGLDPKLAVFRCMRQMWDVDVSGQPVLAILCALARDPLLRITADVILNTPAGAVVKRSEFANAVEKQVPDRFQPVSLLAIGRRASSSWAQSGHLAGERTLHRAHPGVTPETVAYALALGRLTGARGPLLFSTLWTGILDLPPEALFDFAAEASRRGWIDLRRAGSVVDVGFSRLLTPEETEALRE